MGKLGVRATFDDIVRLVRKPDGKLLATGTMLKGLYILDKTLTSTHSDAALVVNLSLWHQRFAHVSPSGIKVMAENGWLKAL